MTEPEFLQVAGYEEAMAKVQGQLCIAQEFQQAWQDVLSKYPQYGGVHANLMAYVTSLRPDELVIPVEAFENMLAAPGNPFTLSAQALEQQRIEQAARAAQAAELRERQQLIDEISQGRTTYTARNNYGVSQSYRTKDLQDTPLDELKTVHQIVVGQRNMMGQSSQELRQQVQTRNAPLGRQYPPMPETWEAPDGKEYELTKRTLIRMPKEFLRVLLQRYGSAAMDERLGVTKRQEVAGQQRILR